MSEIKDRLTLLYGLADAIVPQKHPETIGTRRCGNMRPITATIWGMLGAVAAFGLALALSNGTPKPKAILKCRQRIRGMIKLDIGMAVSLYHQSPVDGCDLMMVGTYCLTARHGLPRDRCKCPVSWS